MEVDTEDELFEVFSDEEVNDKAAHVSMAVGTVEAVSEVDSYLSCPIASCNNIKMDCGPSAYYCDACCKRIHQNILFHKPHQWKQTMYVPIQMTNELARKDHICESSYSTSIYAVDVRVYNIHNEKNIYRAVNVRYVLSIFALVSMNCISKVIGRSDHAERDRGLVSTG
ncbi:Hypothetical predicted protein, partial [Mytilus galloprovincialis]